MALLSQLPVLKNLSMRLHHVLWFVPSPGLHAVVDVERPRGRYLYIGVAVVKLTPVQNATRAGCWVQNLQQRERERARYIYIERKGCKKSAHHAQNERIVASV